MIYTVTFNPALDYVMRPISLCEGQTCRSASEELYFGGKGINVSVVLKNLSVPSRALGFIAGFTGKALEKHLKESGIDTDFIELESGLTRINVKLKGERETEINAQGPHIDKAAIELLFEKLDALKEGDTLVLSGSVPPALPNGIYADIMARLSGRGVRFAVDAAGALLERTLTYKPFLIKPNLSELSEIYAAPLSCESDIIAAAKALQSAGAQNVLVSLGADGALLLDAQGKAFAQKAYKGRVVNTVGAGDSMLAAFLAAANRGSGYALKFANAAGAACAFSPSLPTKAEIENIMKNA